jgi:hypothetical protein
MFDDIENLCVNPQEEDRFKPFRPVTSGDCGEVMAKEWARDTLEAMDDFDEVLDLLIGILMYGDKTGTDVNQRYPLEPWMYTIGLLRRHARESSDSWRHLGFMPSLDFLDNLSSVEKLQRYHDYMSVLLREFKELQDDPPVMWVNLGGIWQKRRLRLKLAIISGDQKSQDNICGRRPSNNGNAGRIHRGCGSSAIHLGCATDSDGLLSGTCRPPQTELIKRLNTLALLDIASLEEGVVKDILPPSRDQDTRTENKRTVQMLHRIKKVATVVLNKVFSMHAHTNAFEDVDFGANPHGVYVATTEDHMHSFEAGSMHEMAEVSYHGLSPTELTEFEGIIRKKVLNCKSSASNEVPRGTVKKDFGKLTLTSHHEKVGSVFYLLLALHDRRGRMIFEGAHARQAKKYMSFTVESSTNEKKKSNDSDGSDDEDKDERQPKSGPAVREEVPQTNFPFRSDLLFGGDHSDKNPFQRTNASISFVCKHLQLHGFGFLLEEDGLDVYQLELLMVSTWPILRVMEKNKVYPTPSCLVQLSSLPQLRNVIPPTQEQDDGSDDGHPSEVEKACIQLLPRKIPQKTVDATANHKRPLTKQTQQPSLRIPGCIPKHRRKKPKVKGTGFTGAVLCNMDTFVAVVELMLTYHAWCHYSSDLPKEDQEAYEVARFGKCMVVQYFDATIYKGDDTVDSDSGKLHSQLHDNTRLFGDQMGHNTSTGERGLKDWAKMASNTALRHMVVTSSPRALAVA